MNPPTSTQMQSITLENRQGLRLKLLRFGGIVSELHVPDRDGRFADVVLGFDSAEAYRERNAAYLGALIGRFGNRIARSRFQLDGESYDALLANDGPHHLHGGKKGFDKVEWEAAEIAGDGFCGVELRYLSVDGEEGYPGNLDVKVLYKLSDENEWIIEYEATTDKPTVFNPTQHAYFNLCGHDGASPLDHQLRLNATYFTPGDADGIPTGEVRPVAGSGFDFRVAKSIGQDIDSTETPLASRGGYDHNFVIDKRPDELALAAEVWEPVSGRRMEVYTTEPGVQFYSGNFLDGSALGKGGYRYGPRSGFCLETQRFPDSPNKGHFPSVILRPGQTFRSKTIYVFGAR